MAYEASLFMHEMDRRAMDALNAFPMFAKLCQAYRMNFDEQAARIELLSTAVRLNENQMPEVYRLLPPICEKLGIAVPELYYITSDEINAATMGTANPVIYLTSSICEKLSEKQLSSVLAHECGHIACRHCFYHSIAEYVASAVSGGVNCVIPAISRFLNPALENAIRFWERCSELSADRAAVLCDEEAENMIDALLQIHGFDKNVNRKEFLRQAVDLHDLIDASNSNKMIEQLLVKDGTHPFLSTRVYECNEWAECAEFQDILNGTYTEENRRQEEDRREEQEVLSANVQISVKKDEKIQDNVIASPEESGAVEAALDEVNQKLESYTSHLDMKMYGLAMFSGLIAGTVDALFIGETSVTQKEITLSHQQVNRFIQQYARVRGFPESRLKDAIADLEKEFKVPQDNIWKGKDINVVPKNHHLADLAHHPTPVGLAAAILVRFLRVGSFVDRNGKWHFCLVDTSINDIEQILFPAVLAGVLNWIVSVGEEKYEATTGEQIPRGMEQIARISASAPILKEVAECADNWFGHLVSDMGGSRNTAGNGMGIPGVFVSFLHELSSLPGFQKTNLPRFVNDLYVKNKIDLRHELAYLDAAKKQLLPVVFNDVFTRILYFACELGVESQSEHEINWRRVIPFENRSVERMLLISSMTFNLADTADAAVRAAVESGGEWVIFCTRFVARYNYVGAGRAFVAIVHEVSNERKEAELIHERLLLTASQTANILQELQEYKKQLEERISAYIAEDAEAFLQGFDLMQEGFRTGNSDIFIQGNVAIQRVLGHEVQFTNQKEFDDLMVSDTAFVL